MPPQCQLSIDWRWKSAAKFIGLGISGVILFGLPESKDEEASGAYDDQGIVQRAIRAIKREVPGSAGDHRRLQLRIHEPRPLRKDRGWRCG
jgi:porphobilinogen synthase